MPPLLGTATTVFEVEEKFSLLNRNRTDVESQLRDLGFSVAGKVNMIDWYYDTLDFTLIRQDCWFRFREVGGIIADDKQQWQLKRGQPSAQGSSSTRDTQSPSTSKAAVVYEEIEGIRSIEVVRSMMDAANMLTTSNGDESHDIREGNGVHDGNVDTVTTSMAPLLPLPLAGLHVFAKIATQRSSWKALNGKYQKLTVDLDTTDFEYTVGEVEMVVSELYQAEAARTLVHELVEALDSTSCSSRIQAVGKMECYLKRNRPDVYQICVNSGVI